MFLLFYTIKHKERIAAPPQVLDNRHNKFALAVRRW
jgi:hypothetical protein